MARYNHFADRKYPSVLFEDIQIGEKFRADKWQGKKARRDIVMIKLSELTYQEVRSKKEYTAKGTRFRVSTYKQQ